MGVAHRYHLALVPSNFTEVLTKKLLIKKLFW